MTISGTLPLVRAERLRWKKHTGRTWHWGCLIDSTPTHLILRTETGSTIELPREEVQISHGYAVHPEQVRDVPHYSYGYFFSRSTIAGVTLPPGTRASNRHRDALVELLRDRPTRAEVFFAVEPWRRRPHQPADTPELHFMRQLPITKNQQRPYLATLLHLIRLVAPAPLTVHTAEGETVAILTWDPQLSNHGANLTGHPLSAGIRKIESWYETPAAPPLYASPGNNNRNPNGSLWRRLSDQATAPTPRSLPDYAHHPYQAPPI